MRYLISASLIIVGLIHLLPLPGVLGADKLSTLYGIQVNEPNLAILMRHRAVLFGLLGAAVIVAAFKPAWQPAAFIAGWVSVFRFWLWRGQRAATTPKWAVSSPPMCLL